MKIETLNQWNLVNGCCCLMPACPIPYLECQSIGGSGQVGFVNYESPTQTYYGTRRTDYEGGGFTQAHAPSIHWTQIGGQWIEPIVIEYSGGDPQTGPSEITFSNAVDVGASRAASFDAMVAALDWQNMAKGTGCLATRVEPSPFGWFPAIHLHAVFIRFRWVVPDFFEGKYFKITWDVVEEPANGSPSFFAQDQTWEWTGPGDPDNPDSWTSGWHEIPPPTEPGLRRVVNIRYECYRSSKFGTKPQVTGESYEIP